MARSIIFKENLVNGIHLDEDISACYFNLELIQSKCFNSWFRRFKSKNNLQNLRATIQYANSNFFEDFKFQQNVTVEMDFISANSNFVDVRFRFYEEGETELKVIVIQRMVFEQNNTSYFLPVHMMKDLQLHTVSLEAEEEYAYSY